MLLLDFNVPNARDVLTLQKLTRALGNLVHTLDATRTVVFAFLATRPKEDTQVEDPLDDELILVKLMRNAGFRSSQRIRMALNPPNEETATAGNWDFWQDARVFFQNDNLAEASSPADPRSNSWLICSEICRTTRIVAVPNTISNADLHQVSLPDADEAGVGTADFARWCSAPARAGQRGPEVHLAVMEALCTISKLAKATDVWIQPADVLNFVDFHPHSGDKAIATAMGSIKGILPCKVRHFLVRLPTRGGAVAVSYTLKRLAGFCSRKWVAREMTLRDHEVDPSTGQWISPVVQPANLESLSDIDLQKLKSIPGAHEAHSGLNALQPLLKVPCSFV